MSHEDIQILTEALREYQRFNRIGNDLDAYLYKLAEYALGESEIKPHPEDYGINT